MEERGIRGHITVELCASSSNIKFIFPGSWCKQANKELKEMFSMACIDFSISQERDERDKGNAIVHHNGGTYRYIIDF